MRKVLLLIESSRGSGRSLLRGIAKYSRHHGPWSFYWEAGGLQELLPRIRDIDADGVIMRDSPYIDHVEQLGIPMIVVRHSQAEQSNRIHIVTDSNKIAVMAAEHFVERGLFNFAFCGVDAFGWSNSRREAFRQHLKSQGYPAHLYYSTKSKTVVQFENEYNQIKQWLVDLPKPVGLFCCNDDRSQQALKICTDIGLKVPDEVAILGVDNDELVCELSDPPLSSIAVNFERAGYEAAAILEQFMNGNPVQSENIIASVTHLAQRQSTDVTAIEDESVAQAVRFIREHRKEQLRVDDVVDAVSVSRRSLERRFQQALKRSVQQEIRRVRTDMIAQLLIETDYPILQIALMMGFNGVEHVSRYFRAERNMNLREFRKQFGKI